MRTLHSTQVVVAFACLWAAAILATGTVAKAGRLPQTSPQAIQTLDGRAIFTTYCASCHGASGTGNGPAARSMRRAPPDVTRLAAANGGVFPIDRVRRLIDGRNVEAHGDRDMPVWGDAFKAMLGGLSEETVRARITAILEYLASIQRRQA
jgi:mono/diheme cytochrome c family protein